MARERQWERQRKRAKVAAKEAGVASDSTISSGEEWLLDQKVWNKKKEQKVKRKRQMAACFKAQDERRFDRKCLESNTESDSEFDMDDYERRYGDSLREAEGRLEGVMAAICHGGVKAIEGRQEGELVEVDEGCQEGVQPEKQQECLEGEADAECEEGEADADRQEGAPLSEEDFDDVPLWLLAEKRKAKKKKFQKRRGEGKGGRKKGGSWRRSGRKRGERERKKKNKKKKKKTSSVGQGRRGGGGRSRKRRDRRGEE